MMGRKEKKKEEKECCQWSAARGATLMDQSVYTCLTASESGPRGKTSIKAFVVQPHFKAHMHM